MERVRPLAPDWMARAFTAAMLAAASGRCNCETARIMRRIVKQIKAEFLEKEIEIESKRTQT